MFNSRFAVSVKYGVMDSSGNQVIPPIFDDVRINEYFILGKRRKWGIVESLKEIRDIKYVFDDVSLAGDVLWFKTASGWGALKSSGDIVLEPMFAFINKMENSRLIECWDGSRYQYFTDDAKSIEFVSGSVKIYDFQLGYALAVVQKDVSGKRCFFCVESYKGEVASPEFTDENECEEFLEALRGDYIWTINR